MTTQLPTDEELERWEGIFGGGEPGLAPPATALIQRLLAYVRHLRGERDEWKRRADAAEPLLQRMGGGDRGNLALRLEAEISDLRKQLETAQDAERRACLEDVRAALTVGLLTPGNVRAVETAIRRRAESAAPPTVADEEARLSDPKRHPFEAQLKDVDQPWPTRFCAHCGQSTEAHQ